MSTTSPDAKAITEPVVLVVDDDPSVLEALSTLLTPRLEPLYRVETAASAEEGLALLEDSPSGQRLALAAVISDEKMPGRTGVEMLIELREREEHRGGGRIIITGYAGLESAKRAINEAEVEKYLPKPWDEAELIETLAEMLERFERERDWDTCDVVTLEEFRAVRDEIRDVRQAWSDYVEMRLDEEERDPAEFDRPEDEGCLFAILRRWSRRSRQAEAFLRLRREQSGGVQVDEWAALPTRDDMDTLRRVAEAAVAYCQPEQVSWTLEDRGDPLVESLDEVVVTRWKREERLCSCHQTACRNVDYARDRRAYHCPLDLLEGRTPEGYPIASADG